MAERLDNPPPTNVTRFECGIRRRKWIDLIVTASHACSKGFGFSCFPPSTKTDTSKFQFNVETVDVRASLWDVPLQIHIYLYYLRYFPLDTA